MLTRCPVACKQCQPPDVNPRDYAGEVLVLNSSLGQIRIVPDFVRAPVTSALVLELANHPDACHNCNFYRNEAVPQDGSSGPPYGLLQGSLAGLLRVPEKEGGDIAMKRGHVAMIPGTREFFVNVMDHDTWGSSMTVWGSLADRQSMDLVEAMLRLPYKEVKHPTYGTVMRMLEQTVSFTALAAPAEGAAGATGTAEAAGGAAGVQ
ncbi:hypothetical protein PLESTB_000110100 [Pleodorina starrii]|uniref:Uncharacterized protein n=1 Tax=Pleodorina starrii TaxID=330485 RepID=A0A9W6BB51_9CHLO|nr:hypothetical protein PLESTM_000105600 [Pleodorina starrii]GLC48550.1 hypothetical protein PLESTB_000110100 [Pleodorina starrii]GLC71870.1 hypothetical protein PLESTF_001175900 [Pleodorina starrii]